MKYYSDEVETCNRSEKTPTLSVYGRMQAGPYESDKLNDFNDH